MKKTLLLLVPLLFFIGCEDNDGDEHEHHYEDHDEDYDRDYDDYIDLESFSWVPTNSSSWSSYIVVGYEPPINHYVNKECKWLRLYREYDRCECLENNNLDGTGGTVFVKDLDGINYEYVVMVTDSTDS